MPDRLGRYPAVRTLLCVGGPWDGKEVAVPAYSSTLILPTSQPVFVTLAVLDSPRAPQATVTVETAVYQRKVIAKDWNGGSVRMEILAYFGRDRSDRPEGFFV